MRWNCITLIVHLDLSVVASEAHTFVPVDCGMQVDEKLDDARSQNRQIGIMNNHNDQTLTAESRPPETRYRSMYRSLSTGLVCPFIDSVECCMLVRL